MKTKELRQTKGITLIALIVTVIILLILAGVSISMVNGDGIFSRAKSASETYKAAANNETKILEEYENFMQEYTTGGSSTPTTPVTPPAPTKTLSSIAITTQPTKTSYNQNEVLDLTGIVVTATYSDSTTADVTSSVTFSPVNGTTLSTVGTQTITASYTEGGITKTATTSVTVSYAQYTLGQEVTVGGEQFFVIEENDKTSKDTITLITKYNLDPSSNAQLNAAHSSTAMAFCTDTNKGYWYESGESSSKYPYDLNGVESERATVYNKAKAYGSAKGGTGRLLTYTEANTLKASGKIPDIIYGKNYTTNPVTTNNFLIFWLGTADDSNFVCFVNGENGSVSVYGYIGTDNLGVRPVVTVSKSLVS